MKKYVVLVVVYGKRAYRLFDDEQEALAKVEEIGHLHHCEELAVAKIENENWITEKDVDRAMRMLFNSLLESGHLIFHWKRV